MTSAALLLIVKAYVSDCDVKRPERVSDPTMTFGYVTLGSQLLTEGHWDLQSAEEKVKEARKVVKCEDSKAALIAALDEKK